MRRQQVYPVSVKFFLTEIRRRAAWLALTDAGPFCVMAPRFTQRRNITIMTKKSWLRTVAAACVASFILVGCATDGSMNRTQKGAAVGGASGAALGGLIGSKKGNAGKGAVIGGIAGAVLGGAVGRYMDQQARELEQVAETDRVDDGIIVTMKDKILFDFGKADLKSGSRASLQKMAEVMNKYGETNITVTGHTDNVGTADANIKLSERRARAVADYLMSLGVAQHRMRIMGFGYERPVASNDTADGRAQNRRVEIHIVPNEELRKQESQAG